MAKIKLRGHIPKGLRKKFYGTDFGDRVIIGDSAFTNSMQPLPADDARRIVRLHDAKLKKEIEYELKAKQYTTTITTANAAVVLQTRGIADDRHTLPFFFSSFMSTYRDYYDSNNANGNQPLASFKGPGVVFTVDNTGSAGDLFPPGTKLYLSTGGIVHKVVENGNIEPFMYPDSTPTSYYNGFSNGASPQLKNGPLIVGYSILGSLFSLSNPNDMNISGAGVNVATYNWRPNLIRFTKFIGQDSTYIYSMQYIAQDSGSQYTYAAGTPIDHAVFFAFKKSTGEQFLLTITAVMVSNGNGIGGINFKELTTVEATPKKAILFSNIAKATKTTSNISVNKIIDKTITNLGVAVPYSLMSSHNSDYSSEPTQWMDCIAAANAGCLKCYYHILSGATSDTTVESGILMIKQNKNLTTAPTFTKCTFSGVPDEYKSKPGTGLKNLNNQYPYMWDVAYAAEIIDGAEQYIAAWIGISKNPDFIPTYDTASYYYKKCDSDHYRYFMVFKVDPANDSNLIYQGCIPSFKLAKPMYGSIASKDNKQIVCINADGVNCYVWSSASKNFVDVDNIAMQRVFSGGIPGTISADKQSVWIEQLVDAGVFDYTDSYIYQITFGDYTDVDIRYYDSSKSQYVEDFSLSTLPVSQTNGVWDAKTFDIQVRVKSKLDGVETNFLTNKTVVLRLSGVLISDNVSFVNCDSGQPWQKTITSGSDWVTVSINYSIPITGLVITGEVTA